MADRPAPRRTALLLLATLAGCQHSEPPVIEALPALRGSAATGSAAPRISGPVGSAIGVGNPEISLGTVRTVTAPGAGAATGPGDISLDFVDTDIREVVAQVLGTILRVNYTIDPAVRGTATLRTVTPIARARVLPVLQALLAQNGATIAQSGDLYRVVPSAAAADWSRTCRQRGRRRQRRRAAAIRLRRRPRQGAAALCRRHRQGRPPTPAATCC